MRKQKTIVITAIVLLAGAMLALIVINNHSQQTASTKASGSSAAVDMADVHYVAPANWATLSQQELTNEGAASGIARTANPPAKFTIAIEPATSSPKSLELLKGLTLPGLQRLANFALVSEKTIIVNGQGGEQYAYTFGNTTKTEQQLIVALHGGRAFSLLFTADQKSFNSITRDVQQILDSFAFK